MANTSTDPNEVHARALRRFDACISALQEERALCLADRRFAFIAGAQWEDEWGDLYENSIRPEINKTALGVEKIVNDYRANRVTVNFRPLDDRGSEETADTLDGLFRADYYFSKGRAAADNAFEEAAAGGMGAWRLTNKYVDEYDPDNEYQRICFEPIVDADQSVFFDLNSKLPDKSDAEWCVVKTPMTHEAFQEQYGEDKLCSWPEGLTKPHYDWYTAEIAYVAEYYEVERTEHSRITYRHVLIDSEEKRFWEDDLDDDLIAQIEAEGWRRRLTRKVPRRRIHKWVMSGNEVLEDKGFIAGQCIPIIPVYGQRRYIDNLERLSGHVRKAKDPQRVYNAQIGKLTETAAVAAIERPIFTPQQIAGHEQSWAEANINRAPYALVNPLLDESTGAIIATGPIGKVEPPQLQPVLAALIQITAGDIRELTNSDDGADEVKANISAEAMDIASTRTDQKSAIYMDNMVLAMQRCGEVYLSMAADIYVEEGRRVETMGPNGEEGAATLLEPYTDDSGNHYIRNDFAAARFKVISDVTEATATRRDKTVKTLLSIANTALNVDPEMASAALNTALTNMDGEGIADFQAWSRQRLVRQGIVKPTDAEARQMEEEEANAQPDPQSQLIMAASSKEAALAEKAQADTEQSRAKTVLTLAQAQEAAAKTGKTVEETANIGREAMDQRVEAVE